MEDLGTFAAAMKTLDDERRRTAKNMRLGELIKALEEQPPKAALRFDFCDQTPGHLASYRGYYSDLSLVPSDEPNFALTVEDFLPRLKAAIGDTFTGYKGGEYRMDENTLLWVAHYGRNPSTAVCGVAGDGIYTIIETCWIND